MNLILKCAAVLAGCALISAAAVAQARPPEPPASQAPLTADQLAKVRSVLANYKADALTTESAKALKRALRDAGFRPGPALDAALNSSGFSVQKLDLLDPRPAPGPASGPAR